MPADEPPSDAAELAALVGNYRFVSPGYFQTLGMVLTRGRFFTEQDRTRPIAVVTAQTASRLWPEEDPIGQRFVRGNSPGRPSQEVVGVVGDARILGLDIDPGLVVYLPYWELSPQHATVVARGGADTATVLASVRESVRGLDPLLPVSNPRVLEDVLAESVAVRRFLLRVTAGFAVSGLVLVCLGVFGTVSQRVVRRRREFAIRMALGATRERIARQVCAQGLRPVAAGLAVGVVVSLATARFIETLLFGVAPLDPVVLGGAALAVLGLGAVACLVPAARALRVPPAWPLDAHPRRGPARGASPCALAPSPVSGAGERSFLGRLGASGTARESTTHVLVTARVRLDRRGAGWAVRRVLTSVSRDIAAVADEMRRAADGGDLTTAHAGCPSGLRIGTTAPDAAPLVRFRLPA